MSQPSFPSTRPNPDLTINARFSLGEFATNDGNKISRRERGPEEKNEETSRESESSQFSDDSEDVDVVAPVSIPKTDEYDSDFDTPIVHENPKKRTRLNPSHFCDPEDVKDVIDAIRKTNQETHVACLQSFKKLREQTKNWPKPTTLIEKILFFLVEKYATENLWFSGDYNEVTTFKEIWNDFCDYVSEDKLKECIRSNFTKENASHAERKKAKRTILDAAKTRSNHQSSLLSTAFHQLHFPVAARGGKGNREDKAKPNGNCLRLYGVSLRCVKERSIEHFCTMIPQGKTRSSNKFNIV